MNVIKQIINVDDLISQFESFSDRDSVSIQTLNQQNEKRNVEVDKCISSSDLKAMLTTVIHDHYNHLPHKRYVAFITLEGTNIEIKLRPMPTSA